MRLEGEESKAFDTVIFINDNNAKENQGTGVIGIKSLHTHFGGIDGVVLRYCILFFKIN